MPLGFSGRTLGLVGAGKLGAPLPGRSTFSRIRSAEVTDLTSGLKVAEAFSI
jgi:hypothetical protein